LNFICHTVADTRYFRFDSAVSFIIIRFQFSSRRIVYLFSPPIIFQPSAHARFRHQPVISLISSFFLIGSRSPPGFRLISLPSRHNIFFGFDARFFSSIFAAISAISPSPLLQIRSSSNIAEYASSPYFFVTSEARQRHFRLTPVFRTYHR
jgi:hypothetical protein